MKESYRILSTKKLLPEQKALFINNLEVVEKAFIEIVFLPFNLPDKRGQAVIFTSQNAVKSVSESVSFIDNDILCVGDKTAKLIVHYFRKKPLVVAHSSEILADKIISNRYRKLLYFRGNLRRDELPVILTSKNVKLREVIVYQTIPKPDKLIEAFDAIIFFSPSAVDAYLEYNSFSKNTAIFAIGNTTGGVLMKKRISPIVPPTPTIEGVIESVNHYFQSIIKKQQ